MRIKTKKEADLIIDKLIKYYPDAECELEHENAFQLLVATILSAQCTDVRVNMITKTLFETVKRPEDILEMGMEKLIEIIRPCGFFNSKAKNIMGSSLKLVKEYNSQVPDTMKELIKLPGVGRKTANVVLSNIFGVPAIAVDTHVFRVTNRIGLVKTKTPDETEQALMKKLDKSKWTIAHHVLIFHGRRICAARKPKCEICPIDEDCNYLKEMQ
ncbi:MAG: endonuclease III [Tissierellia bacterium]|nr:endonuclease III [Tissierellia bacterium]